jgi:hypothetical protein
LSPVSTPNSSNSKIKRNAPGTSADDAGTGNSTQSAFPATPVTVPPATALVYFGLSKNTKRAYANRVINQLEAMKAKPQLEAADQDRLNKFGKLFNNLQSAKFEVGEGQEKQTVDALSVEALNALKPAQRQEALDKLKRAMQARQGATGYTPLSQMVGQKAYIVHNTFVPKRLKPTYSSKDIQSIRSLLEEKNVFRVHTSPNTGLIQTSETANQQMLRQWFTDSCMMGMLQRDKDPHNWQKAMLVSAAALNTKAATEAVENTVKNPDWYRKQNDEKDSDYHMRGVFHIYQPESVHFDPKTGNPVVENIRRDADWFNQKRLESQALVLSNLVDTLQAGTERKPWGFSPEFMADSPERSKLITNAVVNMAHYLMAVNTNPETGKFDFAAPSASSWEETPFPGGMTSDTGMTVVAFEKLRDLLFNSQYDNNESIQQIRQALSQTSLSNQKDLNDFIQAGRDKVAERITQPLKAGAEPMQNPARKPDTSLTLLAASDYRFHPDNLVEDARTRLQLVQAMKSLSGDYGMRRYNEFELNGTELHDSYLNTNYHIPGPLREALDSAGQKSKGDFGSGDASGEKAMQDRQALSTPKNAAQWGLGVSASLQALAHAKSDLLHYVQEQKRPANPDEIELLHTINTELHHFTTWNLALISGPINGKQPIRADGTPCPENSVMESYEVVTDLNGKQKRVPGAHTLPWGAAQLYDGLKRAQEAHALEETLKKKALF